MARKLGNWKLWGAALAVMMLISLVAPAATFAFGPENRDRPLAKWYRMDTSLLRVAADLFGVEPVELSNQMHEEEKTVFNLAPDYGYTADDVVEAAVDARADVLAKAVEAGKLTQERADEILTNYRTQLEACAAGDCPKPAGRTPRERVKRARDQLEKARRGIVGSAATLFGIEPEDLAAELREGSSLLEAAESRGFDADDLVDAFIQDHRERLDAAVEEGKITQERADTIIERFTEMATRALEGEFHPWNWVRQQTARHVNAGFAKLGGNLIDVTADLLGVEPEEVIEQLQGGATIVGLLEESGYTVQDLADAYLQARADILTELVEAGRITQERADWLMEKMESRIETALESGNWPPARPPA